MEQSILKSTKKVLNIGIADLSFDLDVLTYINAAFSILNQLGVGLIEGYVIEDDTVLWTDLSLPTNQMNLVKTYVYLKTRMLFDPPTTSFLIEACNKQIEEYEWRLNVFRETVLIEEAQIVI